MGICMPKNYRREEAIESAKPKKLELPIDLAAEVQQNIEEIQAPVEEIA